MSTVVSNQFMFLTALLVSSVLIGCGSESSNDSSDGVLAESAPAASTLEQFAFAPEQVLMVGDSETDVLAAQAASVDVACMRDGYNHGVDVATLKADFILETFADLPGL